MIRYILTLSFLIFAPIALAEDYVRCSDAEKLCNGYDYQVSATSKYCDGINGICETAPSICSKAKDMCSEVRTMQQAAEKMCVAFRAGCK